MIWATTSLDNLYSPRSEHLFTSGPAVRTARNLTTVNTPGRSALTDCTMLLGSQLGTHKAILIYGYDYPDWPMDPAIKAFQSLASQKVKVAVHAMASFNGAHPPGASARSGFRMAD